MLDKVILIHGSKKALADAIKVSPQAVQQWDIVPTDRVLEVSESVGWQVTPHQLRPDKYPHPEDGLPDRMRQACSARVAA